MEADRAASASLPSALLTITISDSSTIPFFKPCRKERFSIFYAGIVVVLAGVPVTRHLLPVQPIAQT